MSRVGSHGLAARAVARTALGAALAGTLILLAARCASPHTGPGSDRALITQDELDSSLALNAYDAVSRLRPMFLMARGREGTGTSAPPALPNVFVDNMYYGDVTVLRAISARGIDSIRFFSAAEAQYKFGRGNTAGVIDVFTKH